MGNDIEAEIPICCCSWLSEYPTTIFRPTADIYNISLPLLGNAILADIQFLSLEISTTTLTEFNLINAKCYLKLCLSP